MLFVCLFVLSLTVVYGTPEATKCCAPDRWEGGFGELFGAIYKRHPIFGLDNSRISYDYTGKRIAVRVNFFVHRRKGSISYILNFANKKMYVVYKGKCKIRHIKFPLVRCCIPSKAKLLGKTYIGAGSDKLNVRSYGLGSKKYQFYVVTSVTDKTCIPVGETVFQKFKKGKAFRSIGFFGITPGIKDPKVFVPPSSCKREDISTLFVKSHAEDEAEKILTIFMNKFT